MLRGSQSWFFDNKPIIMATGITGGPMEAEGRLAEDFDLVHDDLWMGEDSYEKAHRLLIEEAIDIACNKANLTTDNIDFMIAGDLINQITPTTFAARSAAIPYLGIFGACSTSMEGLALAAFIINQNGANYILTGSASHNACAERQFRYPTEYGGQKPPTAQYTATGAGYAIITKQNEQMKNDPKITTATIGRVIDMGMTDPFNMGGAMAPAAVDTIINHFNDTGRSPDYYDLIITGDLGKVGRAAALDLFHAKGINVTSEQFQDCGLLLYKEDQPVFAGGSGSGLSAIVLYGHLLKQLKYGTYKRILSVATGSLHSALSIQQKESIPCIAHAVSIEID